jgi:hypothetical protein
MPQLRRVFIETHVERRQSCPRDGHRSELREALVNLVLNAVDSMPEGGKLTLRAGYARESPDAVGRVHVEVADTGAGMDEETRRRCLEPFFTTKGERGTGLGLAMVYGIAQRHDLQIDIVSAPGAGTTFRLTFPPAVHSAKLPGAAPAQKFPRRTRILLVDDDPLLLTSLRDVLVDEGHDVETADGGRAGIEAFLVAQRADDPSRGTHRSRHAAYRWTRSGGQYRCGRADHFGHHADRLRAKPGGFGRSAAARGRGAEQATQPVRAAAHARQMHR